MTSIHKFKAYFIYTFSILFISLFYSNCGKFPDKVAMQSDATSSMVTNDIGGKFSGQLTSLISSVSILGEVWGYAYDPQNTSSSLKVILYIDGPVGSGQYIGETQANQSSPGPNNGHYFRFQLPAQYADGNSHQLYVYGFDVRPELLLKPGAFSYLAYTPKAENVFNVQLKSFTSGVCASCHSWSYSSLYTGPLMKPTPANGGSPTNNLFIQKMAGLTGHSGGKFCNGVNDGICLEIQNWWNAEFKK